MEVDEARNFLVQDLLLSGGIDKFGYARGMEPADKEAPLINFMEQPIHTDGLRAIFIFSTEHVDIRDTRIFNWEWPEIYSGLKEYLDEEAELEAKMEAEEAMREKKGK